MLVRAMLASETNKPQRLLFNLFLDPKGCDFLSILLGMVDPASVFLLL